MKIGKINITKKIILFTLCNLLLITMTSNITSVKAESKVKKATITVSALNIRKSPSSASQILGRVYKEQTVTVLEETNDWLRIITNKGQIGYIYKSYTTLKDSNELDEFKATILVDTLNVRKSPSTSTSIIGQLKKNKSVKVIDIEKNWLKVKLDNGKIGYVYKKYTSFKNIDNIYLIKATITTDILNIRKNPSTSSEILGKVYRGQTVTVTEISNYWLKIKTNKGKVGYIYKKHTKIRVLNTGENNPLAKEFIKLVNNQQNNNIKNSTLISYKLQLDNLPIVDVYQSKENPSEFTFYNDKGKSLVVNLEKKVINGKDQLIAFTIIE